MKNIVFRFDNRQPSNTQYRVVSIPQDHVEDMLKDFFGWRTPTKYYNSILQRYQAQGSVNYDDFIVYAIKLGYGIA